ncbi:MAG TPA: enolase C-terminal domain-like protein [Gemmataceae bacterium]|nr:enolase C-terminal domain-like protein [Gemmataceae bacterium]
MKPTDIRIDDVSFAYEDFRYRTPIKFGGVALDRASVLNVEVAVRTRAGKSGRGFGSMPMGNVWSFPSKTLTYDQTLGLMKAVVERVANITRRCTEVGHPIDLTWTLEHEYVKAAREVSAEIPVLCTLVCASSFDAALHDAFGKVHGLNCYHTYGVDFMNHDVGHYLGADFKGDALDRYVRKSPQPKMPLYHLIGALDPLEEKDIVQRVGDGLPETLGEWIRKDGLTHLKIKLNGDNLDWDVGRVVNIDRVCEATQTERGIRQWWYSLDFNEKCPNVAYLLEFLQQVKAKRSAGFERIQYIEQPTARDLKANRQNVMHEASKVRPVVIDESLIDLESLLLAREMGYTGAALKACKGQTQSLLMAAAAQKLGMFLCVQDLTCVGASLIHSAGLAAHVPGVAAIESNGRQYCPIANEPWAKSHPGIMCITDGTMATETLTGPGLSATPSMI